MGGAAGHLQHLYENRELTFKELKQILTHAATGRLEETTEKFDGMNLMFSWDFATNSLRVARADGDIKRGGMNSKALSEKFKGRGHISEAFNTAFKVLRGALSSLSPTDKRRIFGTSRNRWYSAEVIYTENPNVVNYDCNAVTFHKWPVKSISSGRVITIEAPQGVEALVENVSKMQRAVSHSSWKLSGPRVVHLQKLSDGTVLKESIKALDLAMRRAGVTDSNTVGDYLRALVHENALDLTLPPRVTEMVVSRCMGDEYAPTLIDIKKCIDKSEYVAVRQFVENCPKLFKECVRPLSSAINSLACEMLKGLQSSLVENSSEEVDRIKAAVEAKIRQVEESGDDAQTPIEGVVFMWKGNAYKFTGNFSAACQILGLFRY